MVHIFLPMFSLFALAAASDSSRFIARHHSAAPATPSGPPTKAYQQMIISHAILCSVGFAVFLPIGALVARYLRTFSPVWYKIHWIVQFAFGGLWIIIGCALGFAAGHHGGDTHKSIGTALLALYITQCWLGAIIHWVKPKKTTARPPQNYLHAIFGIVIIALALYQIDTGIQTEWLRTGLEPLPAGLHGFWAFWCVALALLYAAWLTFLRKQYRQEEAMCAQHLGLGTAYGMGVSTSGKLRGDAEAQRSEAGDL